jgi:hypothetical protein
MRKIQKKIGKLLIVASVVMILGSCKKEGETVPLVKFEPVKEFSRDELCTFLEYNGRYGRISKIQYQVGNSLRSSEDVAYTSMGMNCYIDTLIYEIKLGATIGGSRALSVSAYRGVGIVYYVEYYYDNAGRLNLAKLIRPSENKEDWISYDYGDNKIVISESGEYYGVSLSKDDENTGYVCNAYAFAEAPLTNRYIINPDLYFLNIYGMPIECLPVEQTIERVDDNDRRLTRVGKYYYKY